jgi:hypothetical protein
LLKRALPVVGLHAPEELLEQIAIYSNGDARQAYNTLEAAAAAGAPPGPGSELTPAAVEDAMNRKTLLYDKGGEEHYNVISALHKSVVTRHMEAVKEFSYAGGTACATTTSPASSEVGQAVPPASPACGRFFHSFRPRLPPSRTHVVPLGQHR